MDMEQFLTPDEVAKKLNINSKTIRDWLRAGKLKGHKLGGSSWRISEKDLYQFIEDSRPGNLKRRDEVDC